jgi:predicted ribosomally synthesized peptide with SipW-like signal peptide
MNNKRATKRALLTSVMALVMCVVMLVGTTFAWFTDTASTGVNKIQAGNLDIELQMKNNDGKWVNAEGETLTFKTKDNRAADQIFWEPGCTYALPELRVVNNGNLALKYKVVVSGIQGSAKLNEVIDWTMKLDDADFVMGSEHSLAAKNNDTVDADIFTISGTMDKNAGNEYQKESIDGINITVYATQDTVENDSFGNTYDKDADGTPQFDTWYDNVATTVTVNTTGDTVVKDKETEPTIQATVPADSTTATQLTLVKNKAETPANITVVTGTKALTAEVKLIDQDGNKVNAASGKSFTVSMEIGKNLNVVGFYHNEMALTKVSNLTANDQYYYDATTGYVTFTTDDFSPFTAIVSDSVFNGGGGTEEDPYLIATAEQAMQIEKLKGGAYLKLVNDITVPDEIYMSGKKFVLDLNGHTIKLEYAEDVKPNNGSVLYIGGKRGSLTINDSSAAQTGAVIGSDKTYTNKVTSAVRAGNYGKLTINGGHFYGTSEGTSCIFVYTSMSSGSKATVTINGGKFETATPSNGIYYVLNHQDGATAGCTITVNGGSFKNYNPGVTAVDPVNAKTGKIVLGEGCTTTQDGEWYVVSK